MSPTRRLVASWASLAVLAAGGTAQSLVVPGFESPGFSDFVAALHVHDPDGAGPLAPALIAGGAFAAGPHGVANHLARWSGSGWMAILPGVDARIAALASFDPDGAGPGGTDLVVAGAFEAAGTSGASRIARFDGTAFQPLGLGLDDDVAAMCVFDADGVGPGAPQLVAGGDFEHAGTVAAAGIAAWDGSAWRALDSGLDGPVAALAVHDGALIAGGFFAAAGGVGANAIARWNGAAWSALGAGFDGPVHALASFDPDGGGPLPAVLVAGGAFTASGTTALAGVASWNGAAWQPLGSGVAAGGAHPAVRALLVVPDGSGARLLAAGLFRRAGAAASPEAVSHGTPGGRELLAVASWDGSTWSSLGSGIACASDDAGRALAWFNHDGDGTPSAILGGHFALAGGSPSAGIARFDGATWTRMAGTGQGASALVRALCVAPDGRVAAGGAFAGAGTARANRVALWDGAAWSAIGAGAGGSAFDGEIAALCSHSGALVAGGTFSSVDGANASKVARWNGTGGFTPLGVGFDGDVLALATFGGHLVAGGAFGASGATETNGIALWDEVSQTWNPIAGGVSGSVRALLVAVLGEGSALYVGGDFSRAGGIEAFGVARWDGVTWSALGEGLCCGGVNALALHGGALHAGGAIDASGPDEVAGVARYDLASTTWVALGLGLSGGRPTAAHALASHGGALVAGGDFTRAGGASALRLATWDGTSWSPFGGGADGGVRALLVVPGASPALWIGGGFTVVDGRAASRVARTN